MPQVQKSTNHLVKKVILRFKRLNPENKRTIVALSGGADSIALLHCLSRIKDLELMAGHIRFDIRPESETDNDYRCAKEAAEKCDVDFLSRRAKVDRSKNIEQSARELRYGLLDQMLNLRMSSGEGQDYIETKFITRCNLGYIATGHHADDQLETVIMFLVRGAGLAGLSGMAEKGRAVPTVIRDVLRPMLCITHQEAIAICEEHDLEWAEDLTNQNTDLTRNKIRHDIVPLLKEINPKAVQHVSQSSDIIRSAQELVEQTFWNHVSMFSNFSATGHRGSVRADALRLMPDVVIYYWLGETLKDITRGKGADKINKHMLDEVVDAIRDYKTKGFDWPFSRIEVTPQQVVITKVS